MPPNFRLETPDSQRALELAYRFLGRRERTEAEVRRHLASKQVDARTADKVVCVLVQDGCLGDGRFARLFAQDKRELEQWGTERIRGRLLARGVEPELVEEALANRVPGEGEADDGELARAVAVLRQRFGSPAHSRGERDRQLGVLLRKGYPFELALEALETHAHLPRDNRPATTTTN